MIISDLITDNEVEANSIDTDNWCSCIDGALTKENYIKSIREAGFKNIEILDEKPYLELEQKQEQKHDGNIARRKITSLTIKVIKD